MKSKLLLAIIIIYCFMIGCFSTSQSYALTKKVTTDKQLVTSNKVIPTQNSQTAESDKVVIDQTTGPAISTPTAQEIGVEDKGGARSEEDLWYRKQNPMEKEHQKLLWEYCKKRNIDYIDMLALIYTESGFNEKCSTGKCYGYFQISKGNCDNLAATLKTKNKPLEGIININWGTAMYKVSKDILY